MYVKQHKDTERQMEPVFFIIIIMGECILLIIDTYSMDPLEFLMIAYI
jgi:hypothetical protein